MHVACIRTHLIPSASAVSLVPRPENKTKHREGILSMDEATQQ